MYFYIIVSVSFFLDLFFFFWFLFCTEFHNFTTVTWQVQPFLERPLIWTAGDVFFVPLILSFL